MSMSDKKVTVSSSQRIIGNTFFSTLSELSLLMTSVFFILAARYLGDAEYGKLSTAIGFVSFFSLLVIFGFTYSITKVIVRNPQKTGDYVGHALYIQLLFSLVAFGLCLGVAYLLRGRYSGEIRLLMAAVFGAEVLRCLGFMLRAAVKAVGRFQDDTVAVNAERLLLLVIGIPLLIFQRNVFAVAAVLAFSRLVSVVVLIGGLKRAGHHILVRPQWPVAVDLIRGSTIYVVQSVFLRVYDSIDVVILSLMRPFEEVGWYKAGRQILEGLWFIPNILTEVTYPELSARHLVSKEKVVSLFDKAFKYMLIMGVMVSAGTVIIAKPLVALLYGAGYEKTSLVLIILGITIVPSYLRYVFGNTLVAIDRQKTAMAISVSRSIFNAAANLALIPIWGIWGSALATVATDYFSIVFYIRVLIKERLLHRAQWRFGYKPFAAAAACAPIYLGLQSQNGFVQFAVIIPAYIVFLLVLRVFEVDEIHALRQVIGSRVPSLSRRGNVS